MAEKGSRNDNRATRAYASTLGVLVGLAGVEHGILEVLQGNVRPQALMVDAIGPAQRIWELSTETVLTIVPSILISGILSILIGLLVTIWAYAYMSRKGGAFVFLVLAVALFLIGGGFAPIFLTILAFIAATRIHAPLKLWRSRLPAGLRTFMAALWPWLLVLSTVSFVVSVEIAIFGYPLLWVLDAETTYMVQFVLGSAMLILAILALPAANAQDAQSGGELTARI